MKVQKDNVFPRYLRTIFGFVWYYLSYSLYGPQQFYCSSNLGIRIMPSKIYERLAFCMQNVEHSGNDYNSLERQRESGIVEPVDLTLNSNLKGY